MSYEYKTKLANGNYRYSIVLNLYRDCFQSDVPLDDNIPVGVYLAGSGEQRLYTTITLSVFKQQVSPPGSVDCDFYAKNVCIEWGRYVGFVDLPPRDAGYDIIFERCCRNQQVNILDDGTGFPDQGQTYKCHIPSHTLLNSSPQFSGVPSPYMCEKDTTTFKFNAIDKDGDELVYYLVHPYQGASIAQPAPSPEDPLDPIKKVIYSGTNYNYLKPFGRFNGSVTNVNPETGLTTLMSPNIGSYVVAIEVAEIRNGDTLSRVRMDLQILVLQCPPNERPSIAAPDGQNFTIEAGEELCFDITASDADDDFLKLFANGEMIDTTNGFTGTFAKFTPNNGFVNADGEFCWNSDCDHFREEPYIVTVTVEDDGCPSKQNTIDIQITVKPFIGTDSIRGPRNVCRYNTYKYSAFGGKPTSTYEWVVSNGTIEGSATDSVVFVRWDGPNPGKITMWEVSQFGCKGDSGTIDINIVESPATPLINGKDTVCVNELNLKYNVNTVAGNTYTWWADNATFNITGTGEIEINTYNKPGFKLYLTETNPLGCTSDTAMKEIFVSDPVPVISGPVTVCPNSQNIVYTAPFNSGSTYTWGVLGGTKTGGGNSNVVTITWGNMGNANISVFETNRHGCTGSATLSVSKTYTLDTVSIFGPRSVCEDDQNVPYYTNPVNGSVFYWTINGGIQISGDSSENIAITWGNAGLGSVSIQQKAYDAVNNRLCLSAINSINVTINPKPTANIISGPSEICQYTDSAIYTLNGFAGSTYTWTVGGGNGFSGQGTKSIKVYWSQPGTHMITVKEITSAGCENVIIATQVLVNPAPVTSEIDGPAIVCPENAMDNVYSVNGFASSTYNWSVFGERSFTGQGTNTITVQWEPTVPKAGVKVVEVSDKGCAGDTIELDIIIDRLKIDMRFVSVGNPDDRIIIDWKLAEKSISSGFTVQRKRQGEAIWQDVIDLPGNVFSYTDKDLNTDVTAYDYRVIAVNMCGTIISSEPHTNILLIGNKDENLNINLIFYDYSGWDNGVLYYEIYENVNGSGFRLMVSNVIPGDNTLVNNDPTIYRKCYRVYAVERGGELTNSWSNEICFTFEPTIFVPNAFTPNEDELNDSFGVEGIAIKEFHIIIFDRWGEQLYESYDIEQKWDANYLGKQVQQGTYIYVITYTDFEDHIYTKTGTINLLR